MSKKNSNLHAAKKAKNDEFYTMFEDIQKELFNYREYFRGKTIFLNCDDHFSEFWRYFQANFEELKLERVVATHYKQPNHEGDLSFKRELIRGVEGIVETQLKGDGDFRSPESIEELVKADIVITNPPFSLFREFVAQLMEYDKKFLIVGSMNAITYKEIFPLIKDNLMWLGIHGLKEFLQPDGTVKKFGNICWYTNLTHSRRQEGLILYREFSFEEFITYDNYPAIEVNKVSEIPVDFAGEMGVPITFLTKYNPDQFEIVRFRKGLDKKDLRYAVEGGFKEPYFRIIIRHK